MGFIELMKSGGQMTPVGSIDRTHSDDLMNEGLRSWTTVAGFRLFFYLHKY